MRNIKAVSSEVKQEDITKDGIMWKRVGISDVWKQKCMFMTLTEFKSGKADGLNEQYGASVIIIRILCSIVYKANSSRMKWNLSEF